MVLFPPSLSIFIHSNTKVSKYNSVFISLTFIFHAILQSFKEKSFNQLLSGAMSCRGTNTEKSVIRESNLEGHKSPFWIGVNLSDTFKTWASNPFVSIFLRVRKIGPNTFFFLSGVFDDGWYEFQLKYWCPCFVFCKIQVLDLVSRDPWCKQHWHISCCNH